MATHSNTSYSMNILYVYIYECELLHSNGRVTAKPEKTTVNTGIPHFQKLGDDKDSRVTSHDMMQSSGYQLCSNRLGHL